MPSTSEAVDVGKGFGDISNRVRELRATRDGMTQQALADAVGVTRQTIHALENAKYSPSLEVAFRVAEALGVPLDQVFSYSPRDHGQRKPGRRPNH